MREWLVFIYTDMKFPIEKQKVEKSPRMCIKSWWCTLYIPDSFIREFAAPHLNAQASCFEFEKQVFLLKKKKERKKNRCERHLLRSSKTSHNSDEPERLLTEKSPHLHYYTFWLLWWFEQSPKTDKWWRVEREESRFQGSSLNATHCKALNYN